MAGWPDMVVELSVVKMLLRLTGRVLIWRG
ncbi:hypothetical protein X956_01820 [Trueperella pyogenes TP8]|nr:hypothetical protein X956_01820 [Trueperella pyogenes TP8]